MFKLAQIVVYAFKLSQIEAAIQAIAPDLNLPPRRYKPNPIFARNELPRLAIGILREAGEPLPTRMIAMRALAAKGVCPPTGAVQADPDPVGAVPVQDG